MARNGGGRLKLAFWIGWSVGAPMKPATVRASSVPIRTKLWLQELESCRTFPRCSRHLPTIWMRSSQRSPRAKIIRAINLSRRGRLEEAGGFEGPPEL
jgi:hypothetical protein